MRRRSPPGAIPGERDRGAEPQPWDAAPAGPAAVDQAPVDPAPTEAAPFDRAPASGPAGFAELERLIADRFESLPARLQAAARHLIDHPNDASVQTVKALSAAAGLQPSVLVRLAQALGYKGFSQMQGVFRSALLSQTQSYGERMRTRARGSELPDPSASAPDKTLRLLCDGSIGSLEALREANDVVALEAAVARLARARTIHVLGLRRAWPIATYLVYLLSRTERSARLLGGMGGMLSDELRALDKADVLVAISFQPFHPDTLTCVSEARQRGIPVVALSDSRVSSLARNAEILLEVHDAEILGFRSVAAAMVLCHSLAVGLAMAESGDAANAAR